MNLIKANHIESRKQLPGLFEKDRRQTLFYEAYASLSRFEGNCQLIVLCKNRVYKKKIQAHRYLLSYNHEGIKDYRVQNIYGHAQDMLNSISGEYVRLTVPEAAALIQDSYMQNIRFDTRPANGFNLDNILLECDTAGIERCQLIHKLSSQKLNSRMFVNIYLNALIRMDNLLLYDLSSPMRKEMLGDRLRYIYSFGEEFRNYTFLQSGIVSLAKTKEGFVANVYILAITLQEEILKIYYQLSFEKRDSYCFVNDFVETKRELIGEDHPDNPFYFRVYASFFRVNGTKTVRELLDDDKDVFLTGEMPEGVTYKWLQPAQAPWEEFDINDKIKGEYILTGSEIIVYARKPQNLLLAEKKVLSCLTKGLRLRQKFYLPINKLFQYVFTRQERKFDLAEECCLQSYQGDSVLLHITCCNHLLNYLHRWAEGKISLGSKTWYFYGIEKTGVNALPCFKEYYISGDWLKIYVYGGQLDLEIARLQKVLGIGIKDMVCHHELENYYDLFNPPVSEQKKWYIYGLLRRFYREETEIQKMGLVPSLRDTVKTFGAVKG